MYSASDAVDIVYKKVKEVVSCPVYQYSFPTDCNDDAFVVINTLPIDSYTLQKCIVNVNVYAKDYVNGCPNIDKINEISRAITDSNEEDLESQCILYDEDIKIHFSNIQLLITLLN